MITTLQADNALKSVYLDTMVEILNTKTNPLLTKIEQTADDVWGKEIRRSIPDEEVYLQYISTLKTVCVQIKISEKAIRDWEYSGFINILNNPIDDSLYQARQDIGQALYGDGTAPHSLTGIGAIFDTSKPLYGLERDTSPILTPLIKETNELNDVVIEETIDELSERGATTDFIAVSRDVKSSYMQYAEKRNKQLDVVELDGGFRAFAINGIPCIFDKYVPQGCMYLLDTSVFKLHQLCDWRWLESENGKILRQTPDNPNTYTATLVKYCDLICDYPNRQGLIKTTK